MRSTGASALLAKRIENLRAHADRQFIVRDDAGLAPRPGPLIGGKLGDLLPAAEENLAELDRQIIDAERAVVDD